MAEELQSISVTSFRLLPLAIPALPGGTGGNAVRTPTLAKHSLFLKGFKDFSSSESYENEKPQKSHITAPWRESQLLQSCFLGLKNHFTSHSPPTQGPAARKIKSLAGDRGRAGAEERVWGFFEHPRDWGWGCCFSFFHQPPQCSGAAGGNLQGHLHSGSPAPV